MDRLRCRLNLIERVEQPVMTRSRFKKASAVRATSRQALSRASSPPTRFISSKASITWRLS